MDRPLARSIVLRLASVALLMPTASACTESSNDCPQAEGLIGQGVVRFSPSDVACTEIPTSMALLEPRLIEGGIPGDWATQVTFTAAGETHRATIAIAEGTSLYGTGEVAGPLLRNGAVTETWNQQPYRPMPPPGLSPLEYDDQFANLYQSHPWVLGVRADGSSFGILADTTYRVRIDLTQGIELSAETPFPVIAIEGDSPQAVLAKLGELTGTLELPPLWALGYQQARWSYTPDTRIQEIADEFRARSIPCDVLWVDIDYMDGFRIFTFNPTLFPNPSGLNDYLHENGFKSVWILDPGVKMDPGYFVYDEGLAGEHYIRQPDGQNFVGGSWPGDSLWPDYTRPETRDWWGSYVPDFLDNGIDGIWIDLNEPSIVMPPTESFPEDLLHRGGGDLPPGTHARYHNAYGLLMSQATHQAMKSARPERRPFLLSRSSYIGGQRYAAMWTGDNSASWDHLYWSVTMTLNMGLSGQPFAGPDIGGFFRAPSPSLYAHWIGVGAFFPFSRTHTVQLSPDQEPWSFGPDVEAISRAAIERRYRMLPYIYTLFREASLSGLPVWRPVFFADPSDASLRGEDHAFLIGDDVLVEPALTEGDRHVFQTPSGIWREFTLVGEDPSVTPELPVLKIRGGAIVPLGRVVQSTSEALLEPLTLLVSLDAEGRAEGLLYEDAGEGYGYQAGDYLLTSYAAEQVGDEVRVRIASEDGERPRPDRVVEVTVITDGGTFEGSGSETSTITVSLLR
jgi:alpha-glucosidase